MRRWEVDLTLIEAWIEDQLDDEEYDTLLAALEQGSKRPNMKELRPKTTKGGAYFRALFALDVRSRAIILVAGDEAGNWSKFGTTRTFHRRPPVQLPPGASTQGRQRRQRSENEDG